MSNLAKKDQVNALDTLLRECLAVRNDDEVLLIYDESFLRYLEAFNRDLLTTFMNIPKSYQLQLTEKIARRDVPIWFPDPLRAAIGASSLILNVLDGELNTSSVRGAILDQQRNKDCRLAHIPGISDEILKIVSKTNFTKVLDDCELVAWFFGRGGDVVVTTFDSVGCEYRLFLELEGWSNEPLMSSLVVGGDLIINKGALLTEDLKRLRGNWTAPPVSIDQVDRIRLKDDEIIEEEGLAYRRLYKSERI